MEAGRKEKRGKYKITRKDQLKKQRRSRKEEKHGAEEEEITVGRNFDILKFS